jgi:hypothetical protein
MIYNLFITEPNDAIQDVLECNFGFQVTSVAGVEIEQKEEDKEDKEKEDEDNKESKEKEDKPNNDEFTAMQ